MRITPKALPGDRFSDRQGIDVQQACRTLGVSQAGCYAWKDRPDPPTAAAADLAGEIADVHKASRDTYGALRITAELSLRPRRPGRA